MNLERWVEQTTARTGLDSPADAERVLRATLGVLGQRLVVEEADAIGRELPSELADALRRSKYERDFEPDELFDRVARREATPPGFAREHAAVVFQLLAEALSPEVLLRLDKHLGAAWARLFVRRASSVPPPRNSHLEAARPRARSNLAEGRPGSRHPLSESRADRAQADSVARSDDPHGDTKLSSARGLTQEREHETLAEGRPGPKRTLGET